MQSSSCAICKILVLHRSSVKKVWKLSRVFSMKNWKDSASTLFEYVVMMDRGEDSGVGGEGDGL